MFGIPNFVRTIPAAFPCIKYKCLNGMFNIESNPNLKTNFHKLYINNSKIISICKRDKLILTVNNNVN